MQYKQQFIADEIGKRIQNGIYRKKLPRAVELADEFNANVKTVAKVLHRLQEDGLLECRRHSGTTIRPKETPFIQRHAVEILYDGDGSILSHPFWGRILEGTVQKLREEGFQIIVTPMIWKRTNSRPDVEIPPCITEGRLLMGVYDNFVINQLSRQDQYFIIVGDPYDDRNVAQVTFNFNQGITDAIDYLWSQGCRKIAFIGQIRGFIHMAQVHKFNAYLNALQKHCRIDSKLTVDSYPVSPGSGDQALQKLLENGLPDAIIAAYDHQLPEILNALAARGLVIPVIGCDGLDIPGLPRDRKMVAAPLFECGALAATQLLRAMARHRKPRSIRLNARFLCP